KSKSTSERSLKRRTATEQPPKLPKLLRMTKPKVSIRLWNQAFPSSAGMAELADAADSKSADLRVLGVRLPLPAPLQKPSEYAASKPSSLHAISFCGRRSGLFVLSFPIAVISQ